MKLERGKFSTSAPNNARSIFLYEVRTRYPEVVEDLRDNVLPQDGQWRSALEEWGERHNLRDEWALRAAEDTLRTWANYFPDDRDPTTLPLFFGDPSDRTGSWIPEIPLDLSGFNPRPYNPDLETREEARNRLLSEFRQVLNAYFDAVEEEFQRAGRSDVVEKRNPNHFAWLACYQVGGLSPRRIMELDEFDVPPSGDPDHPAKAVGRGVRRTAELIGLTLRDPNPPTY